VRPLWALAAIWMLALAPDAVAAQAARVGDLTIAGEEVPVRLVGYGLVTGLDGTGDRVIGGFSSGQTVRSVANLLRNFGVEVPEQLLRTRNVAAVLVTAEASPYLRPGGRFEVQVASLGDAISLRGGVLWMTPLQTHLGGPIVATAQGPLLLSDAEPGNRRFAPAPVETSARIPEGGLIEQPLPRPDYEGTASLTLREPDLATAAAIAQAIDQALGPGTAVVEDPGGILLNLPDSTPAARALALSQIRDLTVVRPRSAQVIIDARDGTVVAGGDIRVGEAVVSHGGMTLAIGAAADTAGVPGDVRVPVGTSVQDVAGALHAVAAPPQAIAAIFESLKEVGAITARVVVR